MIQAYFDGSCGPVNPGGTAAFGAVVYKDGQRVWECSQIFQPLPGEEQLTSNNVAEYCGLLALLNYFLENKMREEQIVVRGDSNLVIQQMNGRWKIKKGFYLPVALEAQRKVKDFSNIHFEWIPREQNELADELSKQELKTNGIGSR